jgi:ribosomal protein S6
VNVRKYEAMVIFPSSMDDEALEKALAGVRGEVTRAGGTLKREQILGTRTFARRLNKQEAGQYVRLDFEMDPAQVSGFRGRIRLRPEVFRMEVVSGVERPEGEMSPAIGATEGAAADVAAPANEPKEEGANG